jgi:hypothetical protein
MEDKPSRKGDFDDYILVPLFALYCAGLTSSFD